MKVFEILALIKIKVFWKELELGFSFGTRTRHDC